MGLTRAGLPSSDPAPPVSVGLAGGASQCSSGILHSHPPAPGQSTGSAAGRTGTPLLPGKEENGTEMRRCYENKLLSTADFFLSMCHHHTLGVV